MPKDVFQRHSGYDPGSSIRIGWGGKSMAKRPESAMIGAPNLREIAVISPLGNTTGIGTRALKRSGCAARSV